MVKRRKLFKIFLIWASIFILLSPFIVAKGTQLVIVNIDDSFNAHLNHSLPLDTNEYTSIDLLPLKDIGERLIDYKFLGAYDSFGKVYPKVEGEKLSLSFNQVNKGVQDMVINFEVPPSYNTPFFVSYDFSVYTDSIFLKSPSFEIYYPSSLELISTNPEGYKDKPIMINYPENPDFGLISAYFLKKELPEGYSNVNQDFFIVVGKSELVNKVLNATENLNFLPGIYKNLTGSFDLNNIYIIILNMSGGKSNFKVGGEGHIPNLILLDENWLSEDWASSIQIQGIITHELTHIVNRKIFSGEQKETAWLDEGLPIFFEIFSMKNYLNITDYWIEEKGIEALFYDNTKLFTKEDLLNRYNGDFYFNRPTDSKFIDDFYNHAGLVFNNFYYLVGDEGFREFYEKVNGLKSSGTNCSFCDTEKVLKIMETISSESRQNLLFPYKEDLDFDSKIKPFIRSTYTEKEKTAILNQYIANKLYLNDYSLVFLGWAIIIVILLVIIVIIALLLFFIVRFFRRRKK